MLFRDNNLTKHNFPHLMLLPHFQRFSIELVECMAGVAGEDAIRSAMPSTNMQAMRCNSAGVGSRQCSTGGREKKEHQMHTTLQHIGMMTLKYHDFSLRKEVIFF